GEYGELPNKFTFTMPYGTKIRQSDRDTEFIMREGAVFMLPLWHREGDEGEEDEDDWYSKFDTALFEVDHNGLVWSRSPDIEFYRFDGLHSSALTRAILDIIGGVENVGRDTAITEFGEAVLNSVLVVATVVSTDIAPDSSVTYTFKPRQIVSTPLMKCSLNGNDLVSDFDEYRRTVEWWEPLTEKQSFIAKYSDRFYTMLEVGETYIVSFFSYGENQDVFQRYFVALVNSDDTITPVPAAIIYDTYDTYESSTVYDNGMYDDYDGYTVAQIGELAELVKTWHEKY
ncbi:MAG: hypothetical protein FWG45_01750, partial [Oscillospiraceae bacterium]|nr:hypothetical protein [Oscillospiraceae bacterium]